jgi:SsrA-binding protein
MPNLATNKHGLHDFQVIEKLEAGIALTGAETKSAKGGHINMKGSYVSVDPENNVWLVGCHISPYKPAIDREAYNPIRRRRLLLNKKEIDFLREKSKERGLTIMPISVYTKGGLVKLEVGLAKGKKLRDKREIIKKRQIDRDIHRILRNK